MRTRRAITSVRPLAGLIGMLLLAGSAPAQKAPPRVVTIPPPEKPSTLDYLAPVVAPTASLFAVHDALGLLVAGHVPPMPKVTLPPGQPWPQLSYARLDAAGVPGPFKTFPLPKPAGLVKPNYPLALAFHPKLPLLYVFQDIEAVTPRADATDAPVYKEFDHVAVYHLDGPDPELLFTFGRGDKFAFGLLAGGIAIDPTGTRLFVGNVQHPAAPGNTSGAIGCFHLAADGLPELDTDPRPPAADRNARIAAAKALAPKVTMNAGLTRVTQDKTGILWTQPTGIGLVAYSADLALFGGPGGPCTWDLVNRRAELVANYIPPYYRPANLGHLDRLAFHPTKPQLYGSILAPDGVDVPDCHLYRTEHADGYPTLIPQRAVLTACRINTPPVVVTKHNRVAVGSVGKVALVGLDAEGRFTADRIEAAAENTWVRALAYSERFDKLYVGVEPPKPMEAKK